MVSDTSDISGDGHLYSLRDVSLSLDGSRILSGITQQLDRGRIYLIAGPSGSGKTSLLKLLNGLVFATEGSVLFEGRRIQDYNLPELRSRAVLMTQDPILTGASVIDSLRLPFEFAANSTRSFDRAEAVSALGRVGLNESFMERDIEKLSGGERQRVALARALLLRPDVLLADEPTASLDLSSEERIVRLIENLRGSMTFIAVSHSTRFLSLADKVILMSNGQLSSVREEIDVDEFREFLDLEENSNNG